MKIFKHVLFTLLFALLFILLTASNTNAVFYIDNFDIQAIVKENGDMQIIENIKYYSSENKNGVTREINTKNQTNSKNSADGLILEDVLVDNITARKVYSGTLGQNGVYEYQKSGNNHSLKVYMPMSPSNPIRTVTYKYLLKNVAVKYNDTAEIFWNFIGKEWDTSIGNVHIKIILPSSSANDTIYVYGHGSDNGSFTKTNNIIDLYASGLNAYQALDARILFSKNAIPYSNKIISKSVLKTYISEEEGFSSNYEEVKIIGNLSVKEISIYLSIAILLVGIFLYIKFDKEYKVEKFHYYRDIPYDLSPELLQTIYYGKIQNNAFFITFLNLVKKGVYTITKTENEVGKETQLITYDEHNNMSLEYYEEQVKKQINNCIPSNSNSIDILKLKQKMKNTSKKYYNEYKSDLNSRKDGLFGEKIKPSKKVSLYLTIAMIILIIFMVFIAFKSQPEMAFGLLMLLAITTTVYTVMFKSIPFNPATVLFLVIHCGGFQAANIAMLSEVGAIYMYIPYILLFILLQYASRIEKSPKEERQVLEQIKGLRRYIRDFSYLAEKEDISHIHLWEDYFILAIALGLNNKVINYFYEYCQNNLSNNFGETLNGFSSYSLMSTSLANSFTSYTIRTSNLSSSRSSRSSYSGSSGGFSGGSSSGGGGRRWRWRKLILEK